MNKDQRDVYHIDEGEINEPIGNSEQLQKPFMTIIDAPHSVWKVGFDCHGNDLSKHIGTHLYTNPQKELTDEEIINTLDKICYEGDSGCVTGSVTIFHQTIVNFARAILKKASEK
jgi:hypothetical protein